MMNGVVISSVNAVADMNLLIRYLVESKFMTESTCCGQHIYM